MLVTLVLRLLLCSFAYLFVLLVCGRLSVPAAIYMALDNETGIVWRLVEICGVSKLGDGRGLVSVACFCEAAMGE